MMFVRLTRARRWQAGWLLAFAYLLCVLAPTISFALPGSQAASPCLFDAGHAPGMTHVHNAGPAHHVHENGRAHDHSGGYSHAISSEDDVGSMAPDGSSLPGKAAHSSGGQCCGLTCVTALPASSFDIVKPSAPTALDEAEGCRSLVDNAPPRLYRPPIS